MRRKIDGGSDARWREEVILLTQEASQVNRQRFTVLRQEHGPVLGRARRGERKREKERARREQRV
ncbi:hypothetical protein V512_004630 [Mesotoga sp. Brook.08.105.5.1]|nr:hypothetical protein RJ60_11715 [Mesotoga sp. B105.6.4]PVD16219.1 hypothetical protein V512_004630 [Mesotoga sp. Brook.08.105.5.1]